jgi:hypothetical protein
MLAGVEAIVGVLPAAPLARSSATRAKSSALAALAPGRAALANLLPRA